jgi:hypothetical protein
MAELSKQALQVANNTDFPNNSTGYITPAILRSFNSDLIDSTVNQAVYTSNSSSWNSSITNLNAFTSSQQPQFISLNAFTASQLLINSGYNSATQSLDISITGLQSQTAQLSAFTSSINEIRDGGVLQGYSTRFYFGGLVSASIVPNVNGAIASIDILSDDSKLSTSSFNAYTASNAASQSVFSASVSTSITSLSSSLNAFTQSQTSWNTTANASIQELLNLSSSLSGGYATQGELDQSSSVLQSNIDTKLNTSSFNAYTQSIVTVGYATTSSLNGYTASADSRLNNLETTSASLLIETANLELFSASTITRLNGLSSFTASYATTGSNVFIGNQTITGSVYGNVVSANIVSNTASLDLSLGNFFTLNLVSGSTTHLTATNIQRGQTINLLVTQSTPASGSLVYSSIFKFPGGGNYIPTSLSGSKDILTFITFDNTTIYAAAINNLI